MTEQPTAAQPEPIPQHPGKFLLGNLPDVIGPYSHSRTHAVGARIWPRLSAHCPGRSLTIGSDFQLVDEICDESRFD